MNEEDLTKLSETALDHALNPRNMGRLSEFNAHATLQGKDGDWMSFWLFVRNGIISRATFTSEKYKALMACGSIITQLAIDREVNEALSISEQDVLAALNGMPQDLIGSVRLSLDALKAACRDHRERIQQSCSKDISCNQCDEKDCSSRQQEPGHAEDPLIEQKKLQARMSRIRHKILVLSGKGGVGKSTVAVNLAVTLSMAGYKTGLLDVDIHGPSIPTMLGLEKANVHTRMGEILPVDMAGLQVISMGFLLPSRDDAVIWRGPMKLAVIKQFLKDVAWGELDYLIIDSPPGTGDEPLSICQLVDGLDGAVIVTTPQKVASIDVRKSITFCRRLNIPVIGIVENMSGFVCPKCGELTFILSSGGGKTMAEELKIPFLGSIPIDPRIAAACDQGQAFIDSFASSRTADVIRDVFKSIEALP